jgi:photosystem II stability/assembly factor-like uncharacterized protein
MKKLQASLFLLFYFWGSNMVYSQWQIQPSGTNATLYSVRFIGNTGFIVGSGGTVLKTTNGGATWVNKSIPDGIELYSLFFNNPDTVMVAGFTNSFYRSTDGGASWNFQWLGQSDGLLSMNFPTKDTGYMVGDWIALDSNDIKKTTNGGVSWTNIITQINQNNQSIYFTDANTGYVAGDAGNLYKTQNGGINWSLLQSFYYSIWDIFFPTKLVGYVVGDGSLISYTKDGGATWKWPQTVPSGTGLLTSIWLPDTIHGYIVGENGLILKTSNGGNDWNSQYSGTSRALYSVCFSDSLTGYIVGENGIILKTNNGGGPVGINEKEYDNNGLKFYPNPASNTLTLSFYGDTKDLKEVFIENINGIIEFEHQTNNNKLIINIESLSAGVHVIFYKSKDLTYHYKFIKT